MDKGTIMHPYYYKLVLLSKYAVFAVGIEQLAWIKNNHIFQKLTLFILFPTQKKEKKLLTTTLAAHVLLLYETVTIRLQTRWI